MSPCSKGNTTPGFPCSRTRCLKSHPCHLFYQCDWEVSEALCVLKRDGTYLLHRAVKRFKSGCPRAKQRAGTKHILVKFIMITFPASKMNQEIKNIRKF